MYKFDTSVLEQLVNINSQSQDIAGVTKAQKFLSSQFKNLGMTITWHANPEAESADALVATYGDGPFVVTLLGHSDTVARGGEFFPFERTEDGKIFGAGIADMKGGIAVIIEALKKIIPTAGNGLTLQVVISPNEELGSPGFHKFFNLLGEESDLVLCFEPALEDGSFIGGRSGNRWYEFKFSGEKFHTGRAVKGSENVLHQICELQSVLLDHVSEDKGTKFNFTSFSTDNEKFNVSSSEAVARMDLRFATRKARESFHNKILSWREERGISLTYSISDDCPPLANVKGEDFVNDLREKLVKAEKKNLSCRHCEGASDANYFSSSKNVVLDGLGPRGTGFHSRKEYLIEASLGTRTHALVQFLSDLAKEKDQISELSQIAT